MILVFLLGLAIGFLLGVATMYWRVTR